jgi:chemotaxis response regulator CheB
MPGCIYCALPSYRMQLGSDRVRVGRPKENFTRQAINPLFRTAAAADGPRVIGMVLTGMLDDCAVGLAEIKRKAGIAVVQGPIDSAGPQHADAFHPRCRCLMPTKSRTSSVSSSFHSSVCLPVRCDGRSQRGRYAEVAGLHAGQ